MALIGCGRIGTKKHLEAYVRNSDVIELVAVFDRNEERAKRCADIYEKRTGKKPEVYTEDHVILNRSDIDAVSIATDSGSHHELTMMALEGSKHVLVEKPMALSTKHMDEMINLARRKNLKLGVCFQNRFNPPVEALREKIDEGAFGRIFYGAVAVRWNRNRAYYEQASWRGKWRSDGGVLMNQSTHAIDLLQWFLGGDVVEVSAHLENFNHPYIEAEDFGTAWVKFKNGSVGIIEGTSVVYPRNYEETLHVFGEKGAAGLGGIAMNRIILWRFEGEEDHPFMYLPDPDTVYGEGHVPLLRDFYEAIENDRDPKIPGEEGRKAVEIVLAIYKSHLEGKPVSFPFDFAAWEMEGLRW